MADPAVSAVVDLLIATAVEVINGEVKLVRDVKKEVGDLSNKLNMARKVLLDAGRRGLKDESVKSWLQRLEEACYEMDDVLDEWNYHLLEQQMEQSHAVIAPVDKVCFPIPLPSSCLCLKKVCTRRRIAKKIEGVKARLDGILQEKDAFGFAIMGEPIGHSWRVPSTSYFKVGDVRGRNRDREIVTKLIMSNDAGQDNLNIKIISIVGQGGLGKTTLAQLVYNDDPVKDCFELRIWICVSDPFNLIEIAKGIVEKVEGSHPNINNLDPLLERLKNSINGKRFLLVLDDVWTEKRDEWEPLETCLMSGAIGSKVLVTTRKEGVAKMMGTLANDTHHPEKLTVDETWSLLSLIALPGKSESVREEFKLIGMEIARKCDGLPLAAKTLGSMLQNKKCIEEWVCVLKSEIWELEQAEIDIFPHLLLSYNELSPALKCCFSYCAVFPKDFSINVKSLIRTWLALGYLGSDESATELEVIGQEYFNYLAMHSLFQLDFDYDNNDDGEFIFCKMHDIVHDFAQFLRKKRSNDIRVQETCQVCNNSLTSHVKEYQSIFEFKTPALHICDCLISVRVLRLSIDNPLRIEKLIHLRQLDINGELTTENLKNICRLYNLKTLYLCRCYLQEIPREIGKLIQLRHLDLSQNGQFKEIPREIGKLIQLRHLDLSQNGELKSIPREIGKLSQLRHLDLSQNGELKEIPREIGELIWLRHLALRGNGELKEIPREIGKLIQLRHLDLSWNAQLKEIPKEIGKLIQLRHLDLKNNNELRELPDSICNLHELLSLSLENVSLSRLPQAAIGQKCRKLGLGAFTGKLSCLKEWNNISGDLRLEIPKFCVGDKDIVDEAKEAELNKKSHLKKLEMRFCKDVDEADVDEDVYVRVLDALEPHHNLGSIEVLNYMGSKLPSWINALNQLWHIRLSDFNNLTSLPPLGKLPCLERILLERLLKLEYIGRDVMGMTKDTGNIASSSSSSSSSSALFGFPKLIGIVIIKCPVLREWEDITAEEDASTTLSGMLFPCLQELTVANCPRLRELPDRLLSKASSLKKENTRHYLD